MTSETFPPWVVLHVPHDSLHIPPEVRDQFVVNDAELREELVRMTDHLTHAMFSDPGTTQSVRAAVSRLVIDVERFPEDGAEPMAARGMGAVYSVTSKLTPLRRELRVGEREALLAAYYWPHHERLEGAVSRTVEEHGRCVVIDCHSFPGTALPYECADPKAIRPDICIGTDPFHTPRGLAQAFVRAFEHEGWTVHLDDPFAGALVPASRYRTDRRVQAIMVEVNRKLYLREGAERARDDFDQTAARVRRCCIDALQTQ